MLVYRICNEMELNLAFQDNFSDIGTMGCDCGPNNHHYENYVNYMHFFYLKSSLVYHDFRSGQFVCTYDIPEELLKGGIGLGEYISLTNHQVKVYLEEFIVKSDLMKLEYLKKVEKVVPGLDYDNLTEYDKFLETAYEEPGDFPRERKKDE